MSAILTFVATILSAPLARAQARWKVDAQASLAWWQMNPTFSHLWATTCPGDPEWHPGEGRSFAWADSLTPTRLDLQVSDSTEDTAHVPWFQRHKVRWDCTEAVRGEITVVDTARWLGVRGFVAVRSNALTRGDESHDEMMQRILEARQFPEIQFVVDSLVGVTHQADTVRGSAVGTLTIRNISVPITAAVRFFQDRGGMRVLAKWHVPARAVGDTLTPALYTLTGCTLTHADSRRCGSDWLKVWKATFFMGADLFFGPASPSIQ